MEFEKETIAHKLMPRTIDHTAPWVVAFFQ